MAFGPPNKKGKRAETLTLLAGLKNFSIAYNFCRGTKIACNLLLNCATAKLYTIEKPKLQLTIDVDLLTTGGGV